MANRHTIILMQSSPNRSTRTFMDFESITQAMDGICGIYERKLRDLNPASRNLNYDIRDLYNFMDGLADLSALVYLYLNPAFSFHLSMKSASGHYDHKIQGYLPYDREWIKHRTMQHLKKLAAQ